MGSGRDQQLLEPGPLVPIRRVRVNLGFEAIRPNHLSQLLKVSFASGRVRGQTRDQRAGTDRLASLARLGARDVA